MVNLSGIKWSDYGVEAPHVMENGCLLFKRPPKMPIQGYKRDPNSANILRPLYPPCVHRQEIRYRKESCGCIWRKFSCHIKDDLRFSDCTHCPEREAGNAEEQTLERKVVQK